MFNPGDQKQITRFREIRNHLLSIMPRATFGLADAAIISELRHILTDLNALFHELSLQRPACEPVDLQSTMAETMIHLAHAYDALRDSEQALHWYEQAALIFDVIGQPERALQCRDARARLRFSTEGTFDIEFQRLQERIAAQLEGSLPYIDTLIALGNLYKDADDIFEARRVYEQAEKILEILNPPPLDAYTNLSLEQLLSHYQEIEFLCDLRYRVYTNMVYVYRDRDSAEAGKYFQRAHKSESMRSVYRDAVAVRIFDVLLSSLYETITIARQGLLTDRQADLLIEGLKTLAASNMSLSISVPRGELLRDLQKLLTSIEVQGLAQDILTGLQLHVKSFDTIIEGIYSKQAIEQRAGLMDRLDLYLKFESLRKEIRAFAALSSEQQTFYTDELLKRIQELSKESQRLDMLEGVTTALMLKAELLMALRRNDEAITTLAEARRTLGDNWQHDRGIAILSSLAEANAHKRDWAAVMNICQQGIERIEQYRYKVTGQYLQSSYLKSRIQLYSLGVRSAYELGNYDLMIQWAELSKCRSVLRYGQRILVPTQNLRATEQEFRQVCEQLYRANTDNAFSEELRQKRRTLWDLLLIQRYQEKTGKDFPEFSLQRLQNTLASDEAVIYYYWLDTYTLLIVSIDQQHILVELRALTQAQRKALEKIANFILHLQDLEREGLELQKVMEFSFLLPQVGLPLLEQKQRLLISPHHLLHVIPFHALQLEADFLIQQFAVSYAPNLTSLLLRYFPSTKPDVLAIGICKYDIEDEQTAILEDAESEVEDVQHLYEGGSGTVMLWKGLEARRKQFQLLEEEGKLERFTMLHFATHGKDVMNDTPMESYLLLQDTPLDGLEIANWRLNAEIVVLSACCSGQRAIAGRELTELPGDELLGLQAAFFSAGAKRLFCSLWPVDSSISRKISVSFHRYMLHKYSPEVALQMTIKDYLASAKVRSRKLCYWSPFFLSIMARPELNSTTVSGGNTYDTIIKS